MERMGIFSVSHGYKIIIEHKEKQKNKNKKVKHSLWVSTLQTKFFKEKKNVFFLNRNFIGLRKICIP